MNITKLGHCCLVLEINGRKILTDPGSFTTEQNTLTGIDIVLITHEHGDHFHLESVKTVLANNPQATVITNASVGNLLKKENIAYTQAGDGEVVDVLGVRIEGHGKDHAPIYQQVGLVENTGFFVAEKFFFPGDAFYNPRKPVDILALPVAGPWMKISEAIDYAKEVKPRMCFPVHDGMLNERLGGFAGRLLPNLLSSDGIDFVSMYNGDTKEFVA